MIEIKYEGEPRHAHPDGTLAATILVRIAADHPGAMSLGVPRAAVVALLDERERVRRDIDAACMAIQKQIGCSNCLKALRRIEAIRLM